MSAAEQLRSPKGGGIQARLMGDEFLRLSIVAIANEVAPARC
jgi:hypothetical protein